MSAGSFTLKVIKHRLIDLFAALDAGKYVFFRGQTGLNLVGGFVRHEIADDLRVLEDRHGLAVGFGQNFMKLAHLCHGGDMFGVDAGYGGLCLLMWRGMFI